MSTQSSMRSCTLDWNEKALKKKEVQAIIINSGNANVFNGKSGKSSLLKIVNEISNKFFKTRFLLNFASSISLYGLYLLGAFGNAANKAASA